LNTSLNTSQANYRLFAGVLLVVLSLALPGSLNAGVFPVGNAADSSAAQSKPARTVIESLPLAFELNQGQTDPRVKFLSRGNGYALFLTPDEMVLSLAKPESRGTGVLRMTLAGANPQPHLAGRGELPGKANYLIGNDSSKWRTNVPTYAKVEYASVYPGVDLVYYGNGRTIEYDFVVTPGADPEVITLAIEGAEQFALDAAGDLVLQMAGGELRMRKPLVYQEVNGARELIAGHYVLKSANQVGFQVAAYDASKALVIDPVLVYSTFLGGSGTDEGLAIAADTAGYVYVTGATQSANFPAVAALDNALGGNTDAFVTKFNPSGGVLFSTYLGGGSPDKGLGIAVDGSGSIYVTGLTQSSNFPVTTGAFSASSKGSTDAFVTKLNAAGSVLLYSTFLGGNKLDQGNAIAVGASGWIYVTGSTTSSGPSNPFPTKTGAFDTTHNGGNDAFVAVLNPAGSGTADLIYSTFLGGSGNDAGNGIAVSGSDVYVTGSTASTGLATAGAFQTTKGAGLDAFVAKFDPSLSGATSRVFFTYLGGGGDDAGNGLGVDSAGNAYIAGSTGSASLQTAAPVHGGGSDAFVAKFSSAGARVYFTYLGGSGSDLGKAIALDGAGNAYVTGSTASAGLASAGAFQAASGGGQDAFVAMLSPSGARAYFTYLGGSGSDAGNGIAAKASGGTAYVTGTTASLNFPTSANSSTDFASFDTNCGTAASPCSSTLTDVFVTALKLDVTAPVVTLTSPVNGTVTNNALALAFSGAAGTIMGDLPTVTIKVYSGTSASGVPVQTLTADGSSGAYTVNAALNQGTYTAQSEQSDAAGNIGLSSANTFTVDTTAPGVTINQAAGQPDPTKTSPINFTVVFSESVSNFATGDVTVSGAGATTATVTGGGTTYNVAVSGMTTTGTVVATIAPGVATDQAGNFNVASTSTDNSVTWDVTAPTVTLVTPAGGEGSLTNAMPTFSGICGAAFGDLATVTVKVYSGTSTAGTLEQTLTATCASGAYSVIATTALAEGTHTAQAQQFDSVGNTGFSSANTFTVDATPPVFGAVSNLMFLTGTTVSYANPTAIDAVSGPATVSCDPLSGTAAGSTPFLLGDTTVTCTATDVAGNSSTIEFVVTVQDTAPPTLALNVADVTVAQGAPITLTATIGNVLQPTTTIAPDCVNTTWTIRRADGPLSGSVVEPRVRERMYGIPNDLITIPAGGSVLVPCDISEVIDPAMLPPGLYKFFATYSNYIRDLDPTLPVFDVWTGSVNSAEADLTILPTDTMRVGVDIKPGSTVNAWNCDSQGQGTSIAVLSGEIFDPRASAPAFRRPFNPASEVDRGSVKFGKTGAEENYANSVDTADVNGDTVDDLIFHFSIQLSGFTCADILPEGSQDATVIGIVTGSINGGTQQFSGSDSIRLVTGNK